MLNNATVTLTRRGVDQDTSTGYRKAISDPTILFRDQPCYFAQRGALASSYSAGMGRVRQAGLRAQDRRGDRHGDPARRPGGGHDHRRQDDDHGYLHGE